MNEPVVLIYKKIFTAELKSMQITIPNTVGSAAANAVHFKLPVSFFMVISVVEHGQCIRQKIIKHIAVTHVQPFDASRFFMK